MRRFLFLSSILVFSLILLLQSCGNLTCYQVSGPITQWDYHIAPFQNIRVYNSPQIYIKQGNTQSVVVESEENMFQALLFHIDPFQKLLYIDFDETCVDDIDHFKIFITVDTLKSVDLRGGGEVWVEDTMKTDSMSILVPGNAEVNMNKVSAENILVDVSGTGTIRLESIDTLKTLDVAFSGIGSYFGYDALAKTVNVDVSGAGLIQTTVTDSLRVSISGQGEV
ncbi:MAG: GIN domain-containing protein, partial [Flavobacteriales bacterium]